MQLPTLATTQALSLRTTVQAGAGEGFEQTIIHAYRAG